MTGLFIIAHAPLASALRTVAMHAYPDAGASIVVYDVPTGDDVDRYLVEAERELAKLKPDSVLIMTDVPGATPANLAGRLVRRGASRALAGVSLPMVWRALNYRELPLDELFARARDGALACVLPVVAPAPQNQGRLANPDDSNKRHDNQ